MRKEKGLRNGVKGAGRILLCGRTKGCLKTGHRGSGRHELDADSGGRFRKRWPTAWKSGKHSQALELPGQPGALLRIMGEPPPPPPLGPCQCPRSVPWKALTLSTLHPAPHLDHLESDTHPGHITLLSPSYPVNPSKIWSPAKCQALL